MSKSIRSLYAITGVSESEKYIGQKDILPASQKELRGYGDPVNSIFIWMYSINMILIQNT